MKRFILGTLILIASTWGFSPPPPISLGDTINLELVVPVDSVRPVDSNNDSLKSLKDSSLISNVRGTRPIATEVFSTGKIFWSIVLLIAAWVFNQLFTRIMEALAENTKYRLVYKRVLPVMRLGIWCLAIYVIIWGVIAPPIEMLTALTASLGIAIGFSSQDILKNLFGGLTILMDKPFQVGDKIEIGQHYGEVVHIGIRSVRLVTPDDSLVSVPNSEIVTKALANANGGELNCQVTAEFFLPLDAPISDIRNMAVRIAQTSQYVYLKKPVVAMVQNILRDQQNLLCLKIRAYVLDIRYEFPFKSDLTLRMMKYLNKTQ